MWKLTKGKDFLYEISLQKLKMVYNKEQNVKAKLRLLAAIHRKKGKSIEYICEQLERPKTTIHRWLNNFQNNGLKAKDSIKQRGRLPLLTLKQRASLLKELEHGPPHNPTGLWSTKEVKNLLKRKYGLSFVNQHIWRIIIGLGFSLQRPRKKHYKSASETEITEFKKKLNEKQNITERKDLLWAHKMKPHLV